MECQCEHPGYCELRSQKVTRMGIVACRRGDEHYFIAGKPELDRGDREARREARIARKNKWKTCRFRGDVILDAAGDTKRRACVSCAGNVQLTVFACEHPDVDETDAKRCEGCKLWEAATDAAADVATMD